MDDRTKTFDAETHCYYIDNKAVPSVTEIIQPVGSLAFAETNPIALSQAAARGTRVHELCELIDYGVAVEDLDCEPELAGYVNAYLAFLRDYQPQYEMIEQPLWHIDDYRPFAGTLDRLADIDGHWVVVDLKTNASAPRATKIAWAAQLAGYRKLLRDTGRIVFCGIDVQLKKDGKYTVHDADETDSKYEIDSEVLFTQLLNLNYIVKGDKRK